MALDEASRRFGFLLQRDLRRMAERREERAARGEEITFDSVAGIAVVQAKRGDAVSRLQGEVLATYEPRDRILRWAWAGRLPSASSTHGDMIFREGQARGIPQLAMSVVGDLDEADAQALVELGALVARAEGVHPRRVGAVLEFVGLFDRARMPAPPPERISVPPPPPITTATRSSAPPPRAYRSIPPVREVFEPRGTGPRPPPRVGMGAPWSNLGAAGLSALSPPGGAARASSPAPPITEVAAVREPSRALFLPAANAAVAALGRVSKGYVQGLFVVTIDALERAPLEASRGTSTRRFVVQLVVIDVAGILRALDPPADVVEASAAMVEADRREGNGSWRKLSARIMPKPDGGATLHVEVV